MGARPLTFPSPDWTPQPQSVGRPSFAPLAIVWLCLAFLGGLSGAYVTGKRVERGAEFGQLVALQALEPEMRAAAQKCGAEAQRLATLGALTPRTLPVRPAPATLGPARPISPSQNIPAAQGILRTNGLPAPAAQLPPRQIQPPPTPTPTPQR